MTYKWGASYLDAGSGEIYVYVRPDDKVLPKWERVDAFAGSNGGIN